MLEYCARQQTNILDLFGQSNDSTPFQFSSSSVRNVIVRGKQLRTARIRN